MPRKKIPKKVTTKLQRNVAKQEARLNKVWELMLMGADTRTIDRTIVKEFGVSQKTVLNDRNKLAPEFLKYSEDDREIMKGKAIARLERVLVSLLKVASSDGLDRTGALKEARNTIMDIAKLTGNIVDQHQVNANLKGLIVNTEVSKDDMAALIDGLDKAGIDKKEAKKIIIE